ncbi:DUF2474 family protein [Hoeflea prorocentri]|uniref:DUF2474 family protein n=1 Tax=Hoeflea prorocentri TaxID=1922333 RepID=A0A9X3UEY9_9HYPH|nr:DUF2474 family protein [Hoeflea prorocentri]MCY6379481.1 DUF2474 family protein [Hoeflea prorocentri]MDA5397281.1 DUF2474 family protein [Hoeflea prorocentri]
MDKEKKDMPKGPLWRRLLWFIALWVAGVLTITAVGYLLRSFFIPG